MMGSRRRQCQVCPMTHAMGLDGDDSKPGRVLYWIAAAGASPALDGRLRLHPPTPAMPQVIYMEDRAALIGAPAIGTVDERAETGGFAVAADAAALAACLDEAIAWLTDHGRIGYRDWLDDPGVFVRRARTWKGGER